MKRIMGTRLPFFLLVCVSWWELARKIIIIFMFILVRFLNYQLQYILPSDQLQTDKTSFDFKLRGVFSSTRVRPNCNEAFYYTYNRPWNILRNPFWALTGRPVEIYTSIPWTSLSPTTTHSYVFEERLTYNVLTNGPLYSKLRFTEYALQYRCEQNRLCVIHV